MILTEVLPRSLDAVEVSRDLERAREWLRRRYAAPTSPWVRINLVSSLTGSAAGPDGTSESLTGGADRLILGVIRAAADVVVVGAQSVRQEGYVLPRSARLAIVTRTGDLGEARLTRPGHDGPPVLILCPAARAEEVATRVGRSHRVIALEGLHPSPRQILDALAAEGLTRIVCEGGPSLATQFATAGVVDEFCISVAPVLTPVSPSILTLPGTVATTTTGLLVDSDGFSYLRLAARERESARAATA